MKILSKRLSSKFELTRTEVKFCQFTLKIGQRKLDVIAEPSWSPRKLGPGRWFLEEWCSSSCAGNGSNSCHQRTESFSFCSTVLMVADCRSTPARHAANLFLRTKTSQRVNEELKTINITNQTHN